MRRLEALCKTPASGIMEEIEVVKLAYEAGRIERAQFFQEVSALLAFSGTEAQFVAAWEDIFEENAPMVALVEALHGCYPLYLLSNTSDIHVDYMLKTFPFFGRFKDAVYSYRVSCSKPDPAIYALAARQFGVNPEETVFIDDLPANIAAARRAGFQAVLYDFRQHGAFLEELRALGVEAAISK